MSIKSINNLSHKIPFHYGWIIVFSGILGILACLGFGRFAFGMLLPSIGESLNLTYSQMGFISTGNFIGYLISVLVSGLWAIRIGARKLVFVSLISVGFTMILSSMAENFLHLLMMCTLTGIGSGASNVAIMSLVSSWFTKKLRGLAAGLIVTGNGFAILFSGKFIPFINELSEPFQGWRLAWVILGLIVILIAFICFVFLRNKPDEIGLKSAGFKAEKDLNNTAVEKTKEQGIYKRWIIYYIGIIYFLYGYTYVIYITFIVTAVINERGFSEIMAGNLWSIIGFLSIMSGPVFGSISDKYGRRAGLIIVFVFQMFAYLLIASELPDVFLYLSIGLFGLVAWSIPSIMLATVSDYVKSDKVAAAFGIITFIFTIGQIMGPTVAGTLAELSGSFSSSFYMAAALAGLAVILSTFLKKP